MATSPKSTTPTTPTTTPAPPQTTTLSNTMHGPIRAQDQRPLAASYLYALQLTPDTSTPPNLTNTPLITQAKEHLLTFPNPAPILTRTRNIDVYAEETCALIRLYIHFCRGRDFSDKWESAYSLGTLAWIQGKVLEAHFILKHLQKRVGVVVRLGMLGRAEVVVREVLGLEGVEGGVVRWGRAEMDKSGIEREVLFEKVREIGLFERPVYGCGPPFARPADYVAFCILKSGADDEKRAEMLQKLRGYKEAANPEQHEKEWAVVERWREEYRTQEYGDR